MALRLKHGLSLVAAAVFLVAAAPPTRPTRTFANPINIEYRFMTDLPSRQCRAERTDRCFWGLWSSSLQGRRQRQRLGPHQDALIVIPDHTLGAVRRPCSPPGA